MEYHLQSGSHTVYALQYHFVTVTKYRADILNDERLERVAEVAHEIADDFKIDPPEWSVASEARRDRRERLESERRTVRGRPTGDHDSERGT